MSALTMKIADLARKWPFTRTFGIMDALAMEDHLVGSIEHFVALVALEFVGILASKG